MSTPKPREWWIDNSARWDLIEGDKLDRGIDVIEKSAYDALEQRLAEAEQQLSMAQVGQNMIVRVMELEAEVARLVRIEKRADNYFDRLTAECKVTDVYEAALNFYASGQHAISEANDGGSARKALATAAKLRGES